MRGFCAAILSKSASVHALRFESSLSAGTQRSSAKKTSQDAQSMPLSRRPLSSLGMDPPLSATTKRGFVDAAESSET